MYIYICIYPNRCQSKIPSATCRVVALQLDICGFTVLSQTLRSHKYITRDVYKSKENTRREPLTMYYCIDTTCCQYIYIYTYIYIYMHTYIYIHTHVLLYIYICMYIYIYMHVYTYVFIYVYIYIYIYACIHICIYICIDVYTYVYVSIYIYIYICVYIYMKLHALRNDSIEENSNTGRVAKRERAQSSL